MEDFAPFVRILGRGPGRSRPLTRAEAREAFGLVLRGAVDPHQVGAFLMLLRYRGEDADEVTGLVEAARDAIGPAPSAIRPDLDWPSYGAGRTRGAPWFLLSALALARGGVRVLMHGSNAFTAGASVAEALPLLGLAPSDGVADAAASIDRTGFAFLPLEALSPPLAGLLALRRLFGLRSPVNTVCRLLDPGDASRAVDGVFHPAYLDLHLAVASRLGRRRIAVVKGGGGEAERAAAKRVAAHVGDAAGGRSVLDLPPLLDGPAATPADEENEPDLALFRAVWTGDAAPLAPVATVVGTIALALLALDPALDVAGADRRAAAIWAARHAAYAPDAAGGNGTPASP